MDGSIGAPRRIGNSNKRDNAIRKKRQRTSKMEGVKRSVERKLRLQAYVEKCIACPAYRLLGP